MEALTCWARSGASGAIRPGGGELCFDFTAGKTYHKQSESGMRRLHLRLTLRVEGAGSPPAYTGAQISFQVRLASQESRHACILMEIVVVTGGHRLAWAGPLLAAFQRFMPCRVRVG